MYLVSILVPVYKVEGYIERCARSLFEQTYKNLEFVFVDDCSPDHSCDVLQEVLEDYPQRKGATKILHHDVNKGLAATRNTALDNATGIFVCVVDSDDWMELNAIELLVNKQLESNADIVAGNVIMHTMNGDVFFTEKKFHSKEERILQQLEKTWDHTIWRRIIRRSLYEDNHLRCLEGFDMTEDRFQMAQLAYYANGYAQIDGFIYHYERRNEESIMAQKEKEKRLRRDYQYLRNWLGIKDFFADKEDIYYKKANMESMLFAKQYLSSIVKLNSKKWFDCLAAILDHETPDNQELAGWTTKGIRGYFLHSFYCLEFDYQRKRVIRFIKRRLFPGR